MATQIHIDTEQVLAIQTREVNGVYIRTLTITEKDGTVIEVIMYADSADKLLEQS